MAELHATTGRLPFPSPPIFRLRPTLVHLCVPLLANQLHVLHHLHILPPDLRSLIVANLPLHLPLHLSAQLIPDEEYWKRRAGCEWRICDVSSHGRSWKQLFFERHLASALESFDPTSDNGEELKKLLEISGPFVHNLEIFQLPSHLGASIIFGALGRELTALKLEYGWRNARMQYDPAKFGMKISDCLAFSASLSIAAALTDLNLSCNFLDDEKVKILLEGILKNPILVWLNLSHNRIADLGVAEISKYLSCENCVLGGLNLSDNYFSAEGAKLLAAALKSIDILVLLDLSYNKLGDDGGQAVLDAMQTNISLQRLVLGSCGAGEETALALARLISSSRPPLLYLDLSANPGIGIKGGNLLQTSVVLSGNYYGSVSPMT